MKRSPRTIPIALTLLCLTGCENTSPRENLKENFQYWSNKVGNTCAKMAERDYCFEDRVVDAKNWQTDSAAGFFLRIPVNDRELADCNKKAYSLYSDPYPSFTSTVEDRKADKIGGGTIKAFFQWKNIEFSEKSQDIIFPHKSIMYYGMNCVRTRPDSVYQQEAECQLGKYDDVPPPHFFSCDREGWVPYPGCSNWMFYKNLAFHITYNKDCAPQHALIRRRVVQYIDLMEVKRLEENTLAIN